jgi:hypothetical protein
VAPAASRVGCITYRTSGGPKSDRNLSVTVSAVDDFGSPIAGAQVNIALYLNGNLFGNGTGATTNTNGQVTYNANRAPNGTYTVTVTSINASGLTFDSGSTPANLFRKGTDSSPAQFCNAGASAAAAPDGLAAQISRARAAKARSANALSNIPGVKGHGIGLNEDGRPVIEVYLANENAAARRQIPATIENVPVRVVVTGDFVAH